MKIRSLGLGFFALTAALLLTSCAPQNPPPNMGIEHAKVQPPSARTSDLDQLPVRFQNPSYTVKQPSSTAAFGSMKKTVVPVGADFTSSTPVPLRDIIKQLAQLKGMNVSWASDVDQTATVDVNIRANEDFFKSIDNLLRQLDYFEEVHGNTLIIGHKAVREFHIAMPFIASKFSSGIGGDVLGNTGGSSSAGSMHGKLELTSDSNKFDVWKNIQENLDKILQIWEAPAAKATPAPGAKGQKQTEEATAAATEPSRPPQAKGYYTIDKPIGLITVTAPPSLLNKISAYIKNLKAELYRQVVIEAKIVEVTLNNDNTTGINWESLLQDTSNGFGGTLDFQTLNPLYPSYGRFLTLQDKSFNLFLDAIKTQGTTNVLANPKISVMNGQPAIINIGQNVTYIKSVTSTTTTGTTPVTTYTVNTGAILSGVVLSVVPTILDNNQVILSLSPVTSQLQQPIEYKNFGNNNQVGLPVVDIREMSTMVRLKNNEMLVVGGLVDKTDTEKSSKIPGLGDIPGLGKLFGNGGKVKQHKELVIFLKPHIVS